MCLYPSRTMPRETRCNSVLLHYATALHQKTKPTASGQTTFRLCRLRSWSRSSTWNETNTHGKKFVNYILRDRFYFFVSLLSLHFASRSLHPVSQTGGDSGKNNNDTAHPPFVRGDSMPYHYYFYSGFIAFFHEK